MFDSLLRLRDSRPFLLRRQRMKAPPGGPVCQKFWKRYIATGRRKVVSLVSPRSTVLCFLLTSSMFACGGGLVPLWCVGSRLSPRGYGKCWHLKLTGNHLLAIYLALAASRLVYRVPPLRWSSTDTSEV